MEVRISRQVRSNPKQRSVLRSVSLTLVYSALAALLFPICLFEWIKTFDEDSFYPQQLALKAWEKLAEGSPVSSKLYL